MGKLTTKWKKLKSSTPAATANDANTNHFDIDTAEDKKVDDQAKKTTLSTASGEKVKLPPIRSAKKTGAKVAESSTPAPSKSKPKGEQATKAKPAVVVVDTAKPKASSGKPKADSDVERKKKIASKLPPLKK